MSNMNFIKFKDFPLLENDEYTKSTKDNNIPSKKYLVGYHVEDNADFDTGSGMPEFRVDLEQLGGGGTSSDIDISKFDLYKDENGKVYIKYNNINLGDGITVDAGDTDTGLYVHWSNSQQVYLTPVDDNTDSRKFYITSSYHKDKETNVSEIAHPFITLESNIWGKRYTSKTIALPPYSTKTVVGIDTQSSSNVVRPVPQLRLIMKKMNAGFTDFIEDYEYVNLPQIVVGKVESGTEANLTTEYDANNNRYKINAVLPVAGESTITKIHPKLRNVNVGTIEGDSADASGSWSFVDGESEPTYDLNLTIPVKQGEQGLPGSDGKSAFEIWKEQEGNSGKTEEEFFDSLKGDPGIQGQQGEPGAAGSPGRGISEVTYLKSGKDTNFTIAYTDNSTPTTFTISDGVDGRDGGSAVAISDGFTSVKTPCYFLVDRKLQTSEIAHMQSVEPFFNLHQQVLFVNTDTTLPFFNAGATLCLATQEHPYVYRLVAFDSTDSEQTRTTTYLWELYDQYISIPSVPTNVSAFTNDAGYITNSDLPVVSEHLVYFELYKIETKATGADESGELTLDTNVANLLQKYDFTTKTFKTDADVDTLTKLNERITQKSNKVVDINPGQRAADVMRNMQYGLFGVLSETSNGSELKFYGMPEALASVNWENGLTTNFLIKVYYNNN